VEPVLHARVSQPNGLILNQRDAITAYVVLVAFAAMMRPILPHTQAGQRCARGICRPVRAALSIDSIPDFRAQAVKNGCPWVVLLRVSCISEPGILISEVLPLANLITSSLSSPKSRPVGTQPGTAANLERRKAECRWIQFKPEAVFHSGFVPSLLPASRSASDAVGRRFWLG